MNKKNFRVKVIKEGKFYLIRFPDHPSLYSQATHLREIELMARDVINLMLEIPLEDINLEIEFVSPAAITM
jgi:predicted RNase H-like HicB family nuclease